MNNHHLILGQLTDFITGQTIDDTHDERYRQELARLLVNQKKYVKTDITPNYPVVAHAGAKCARVPVTYIVHFTGRAAVLIHYGPGSLVTRHRPALALARLAADHQIPVVVVTNGRDADILDGLTGKVTASGLGQIPSKEQLAETLKGYGWPAISQQRKDKEERILMAYEVDDRCPCDDTVCRI